MVKCIYDWYNQHWLAETITLLNKTITVTATCIFDGYICTLLERRVLLWQQSHVPLQQGLDTLRREMQGIGGSPSPNGEDPHPSACFLFCMPRTTVGHGLKCPAKLSVLAPWGSVGVAFCYCPRGWSEGTLILPTGASWWSNHLLLGLDGSHGSGLTQTDLFSISIYLRWLRRHDAREQRLRGQEKQARSPAHLTEVTTADQASEVLDLAEVPCVFNNITPTHTVLLLKRCSSHCAR